ncbi:MAG: hypothetical protein KGL90_15450 [Burkholderiales bacterium]|nr:hypothetical protein [Burkholderiales bacterium]
MPNTSATGGYLQPASTATPAEDVDLDAILQGMVAGITGLDGSLVRPRWQPTIPRTPEIDVNWCAIGVTRIIPDDNAAVLHSGSADGSDTLIRHEDIELLASFYGPMDGRYAAMLRDGIQIPQNLEAIRPYGLAFVKAGDMVAMPELFNQQWVQRTDLTLVLRRIVSRTYPVLNILSAPVTLTR